MSEANEYVQRGAEWLEEHGTADYDVEGILRESGAMKRIKELEQLLRSFGGRRNTLGLTVMS